MLSPESPVTLSASISLPNISKKLYTNSQLESIKVPGIPNSNSTSILSIQTNDTTKEKDSSFIPNSFTNKSDRYILIDDNNYMHI